MAKGSSWKLRRAKLAPDGYGAAKILNTVIQKAQADC
jgi:hypothetical protein